MGLFSWLGGMFAGSSSGGGVTFEPEINPATGNVMVGGLDTDGNPYGSNLSQHVTHHVETDWGSTSFHDDGNDHGSMGGMHNSDW